MTKSPQTNKTSSAEFEKEAEHAAQEERAIQRKIDKSDKNSGDERQSGAMQAGARVLPGPSTLGPASTQARH